MDKIRAEMDRLYWNKNQNVMNSPFDNTGEIYQNDVFTVRAYSWDDNSEEIPNFEYDGINVYWYKHSNRGTVVYVEKELTIDYLSKLLSDCIESLRRDFGEY